jgi:hypothetical protein
MNHILYILPLSTSEAFKVGITNNDELNRIKGLNAIYKFNLKDGYLVKAEERIIKSLERQLLNDYSFYKHEFDIKSDGHTEFLKYDCLEDILDDIRFKARLKHINLTINKGVKLPKTEPKPKLVIEKKHVQKKSMAGYGWDFTQMNKFLSLIEDNTNKLTYTEEKIIKDGISGKIGQIRTTDLELTKEIFNYRGIHYGYKRQEFASFIDYTIFYKKEGYGTIQLAGIYDDFKNEKRFDDNVVYSNIQNIYQTVDALLCPFS